MKKLFYLFTVVSVVVAFASCGDSAPDDMPKSLKDSATKSAQIVSAKNANASISDIVFTIEDFTKVAKFSKWIEGGSGQTTSTISFEGLPKGEGFELSKIVLRLGSNSKESTTLSNVTSDGVITDSGYVPFINKVVSEIAAKKKSTIIVTAYSNETILDANIKIKLEIDFKLK